MNNESEKTVVLKVFTNEFEAELAKSILEEEGIKAYISSDDVGGMQPPQQMSEGIKLIVMETDYDKAKEVLDAYSSFTPPDDEPDAEINDDEDI